MIHILHIAPELDGGGIERLLYDYCVRMKNEIKFDFIIYSEEEGILEQPIKNLGFNVFKVQQIRQSLIKNITSTYKIIKNGRYDIIHAHSGYKAIIPLLIAYLLVVKVRIAHSHQAQTSEKLTTNIIRKIVTLATKFFATNLFACGKDAAIWTWGSKTYESGNVCIIRNAIDINKFKYSDDIRKRVRKELNLENKYIIGSVARLSHEKNHKFLIKIFSNIINKINNVVLVIVGRGELESEIKNQVQRLGLSDSVFFLGVRNDVHNLLSAMDIFLLPSLNEGFPVILVETQSNGLNAIVSAKVTEEIKITDLIKFITLDEALWENEILKDINVCNNREKYAALVENEGYDISSEYIRLKDKYFSLLNY